MLASTIPFPQPCARCRGARVVLAPQGERALAVLCGCAEACATCGGSGRLSTTVDGVLFAKNCDCRDARRRVELYNQARIPRHFSGRGFENFTVYEESLKNARQRVQSFAEGYPSFGKGLLLYGQTGTGKTHLLCAALQHLTLERGVRARYVEFSFLVSEIKEAFMRNVSALVALAPLAEVEVLAIDELGKGRASDFERDVLDELISRRYNADRTTLFATNFQAGFRSQGLAPPQGFINTAQLGRDALGEPHLRDRVGDRTYSRLAEMAEVVHVQARDRRLPPG